MDYPTYYGTDHETRGELQTAFDRLFAIANVVCDSDIELSESARNEAMITLWTVLRETKSLYTGELPEWLQS